MIEFLLNARLAGEINRGHTMPIVRHYDNAQHSFNVALIARELYQHRKAHVSIDLCKLLQACLYHDLAELWTGDIPAPAKWLNPELETEVREVERKFSEEVFSDHHLSAMSLNVDERNILKVSDSLELMWFCVEELQMGNTRIKFYYRNARDSINERFIIPMKVPGAKELFDHLEEKAHGV